MQLCRSDGPCSPRPRHPLPGHARAGSRQESKAGSRQEGRQAGTGLAAGEPRQGYKKQECLPQSSTRQAMPASPAGDGGTKGTRGAGGHFGTGARPKGLSRASGPCRLPGWVAVGWHRGATKSGPGISATNIAQLPTGITGTPGDTHPGARWRPQAGTGETGTLAPRRRRETTGRWGTDGQSTKLARAEPRHPRAARGLWHCHAAGPGRRGDRLGMGGMGTETGMRTRIGIRMEIGMGMGTALEMGTRMAMGIRVRTGKDGNR